MASVAQSLTNRLSWVFLRAVFRASLRDVELRVDGLEHLPATGPAVIAARHYHHYYDGAALLTLAPRPLRVVVTLDWVQSRAVHAAMTLACRAAGWPVVPRGDGVPRRAATGPEASDERRLLLAAMRESVALLRAGRMLLVFPEAYPTIDPGYTPKTRDDEVLPFQPGFLRLAALAERDGQTRVPIIPVGLEYTRDEQWRLTVRVGSPVNVGPHGNLAAQADAVERQVRRLSGLPPWTSDTVCRY